MNLDFTTVWAIVTGLGIEEHLNKGTPLPMRSVGKILKEIFPRPNEYVSIVIMVYYHFRQCTLMLEKHKYFLVRSIRILTIGLLCTLTW